LKNFLKYILQKTLGLKNYLYFFARFVILKLPYDKNERDFLKFIDLINDGGDVLDIGANIGVMSYYLSRKLPNSVIHSFEPFPENMQTLLRVKQKFKLLNTKIYPFALGYKSGKIEMIMPEKNDVFFHGLSHIRKKEEEKGKIFEVEIKRLDEMNEFQNTLIRAIKIDVEEYEYEVLKGAKKILRRDRPIMYCELWDSENRNKTIDLLSKLDYKLYINKKNKLVEFNNGEGFQNFFIIPSEFNLKN